LPPLRASSLLALVLSALFVTGAPAATRTTSGIAPGLVHRGKTTTIVVRTAPTERGCTAILRYQDGTIQRSATKNPRKGRVSFVLRIPLKAPVGPGRWTVICAGTLRSGSFIVVGVASTQPVEAPKVVVSKQGFSQRNDKMGTGSQVSYGLLLQNTSDTEDAQNVYLIVNFVASDGELIGSKTRTIPLISAGQTFAVGDYMPLRTQVPTASLEITIRVGAHRPKQDVPAPQIANVKIVQSSYDPGWVGEVDGEVVNAVPNRTLASAQLSVVVLNAAGNPIGGGTGSVFSPVPSGARLVFLAQSGFTAIPLDQAASVVVSSQSSFLAP